MYKYLKNSIFNFYLDVAEKFHNSNFSTNRLSMDLENFVNYLRGVKSRFHYDIRNNFFYVIENKKKIVFNDKIRGISCYRDGISKRSVSIFSSYCLENISFSKNDVVIDCGANYGDLNLKLSNLIASENYIALEPNPSDFNMLKLNVSEKSKIINKGLSNINGTLPFYISSTEADSSFIKPNHFTEIIDVPVIRLDQLIKDLKLDRIKLLKVEAEGYEPEILEGLSDKIQICDYIAIDGGYERGEKKEQTFTELTNKLLENNFKMIDIYMPFCRALFINRKNS